MAVPNTLEILGRAALFSKLPGAVLAEIESKAERLAFSLGDVITRYGEEDDAFYIVATGTVRLVAAGTTGKSVTIALLGSGEVFGESHMLSPGHTVATARAAAQTAVLRFAGAAGRDLTARFPDWGRTVAAQAASNEQFAFLRKTDLFAQFTVSQAREVAAALQTVRLKAGDNLYEEGDPGDTCGLVYRGRLRVWRHGESGPVELATLRPGDVVGEMALLLRCPRIASVTALEEAVILAIERETLARHVSPDALEKILAPIATDRLLQVQAIVADAVNKVKPARFQISVLRKGIWPFARTYVGVSVDQPAFAVAACIRSLDTWFGGAAAGSSHPESSLASGRNFDSLHDIGAEMEARGYLTRLLRLDTEDARTLPLPAVVRSGQQALQTVLFISRREVISSHSAYGLLRQPAEDFLRGWDGWALSANFVPQFSGVTVKDALLRFLPLLRPFLPIGVALLAITLLSQACALVEPFFTRVIVDQVLVYKDRALLQLLIVGSLIAGILQLAASALRAYLTAQPMNTLSALLQVTFFRHILSLSAASTAGWDTARFLTRFEENTHILGFVSERGLGVAVDLISIFVYTFAMLALNPQLAFLASGFIVASGLLLLFSSSWLRKAHRRLFDQRAHFEGFFLDTVAGIYTLKAIASEPRVRARGMELLTDYRRFSFRIADVSNRVNAVSEALNSGATVAILGYGAVLALGGKITAGQLIAFQALMGLTLGPMLSLVGIWNDVQDLRVSLERTGEVYQLSRDISPPDAVERSIEGQVAFRNVTFYYPGTARPALADFSLEIQPGQKVALVGRSGSGKTTIASLMAALYEPASGAILLDGVDLREFNRQSVRRQIGVIEQQPYVFNGTIRENIAKARPTATFEEIAGAATLAGAHGFISEFPMGYDTQIGERGVTLSGGQRQRVVIARALLSQPRILILDEATSALDTESEAIVQQNLDRIMKGRTSLVIAHRLSTVRNADAIVVIDEGKLVEKGTHDELIAQQGWYHYLYSQPA